MSNLHGIKRVINPKSGDSGKSGYGRPKSSEKDRKKGRK
jgi:hypothetical protein